MQTIFLTLMLCFAVAAVGAEAHVKESARDIPVAYNVDVVVVGGSTGAVSAAVAAAEAGAKVFLAAPHPYLGEDMAGALRLWLEEGETPATPLAKALFSASRGQVAATSFPNAIPFTYKASLPSASMHADTKKQTRLTDGRWQVASQQSVQYDGDVSIVADLKKKQPVSKALAMVYHSKDFLFDTVAVAVSDDGEAWQDVGSAKQEGGAAHDDQGAAVTKSIDVGREARYVKFTVTRREGSGRLLLGELVVLGPEKGTKAPEPAPDLPAVPPTTPLQVKRSLDRALLDAKVGFLYSCYATDLLRDGKGKPCGIVMANRAGRQAVVAKVVIDATTHSAVARMAVATFRPYPSGTQTFKRVVVGGQMMSAEDQAAYKLKVREVQPPYVGSRGGKSYSIFEYTLNIPMKDGGFASWAEADQAARDQTYDPAQQFTSDILFQVPPDAVKGRGTGLDAFRPDGVERLFVLGGRGDVSREEAAKLTRPLALMELGSRIGSAAAAEAEKLPAPEGVKVPGGAVQAVVKGDVKEFLEGVRAGQDLPTVPQEEGPLPVLGRYDVVVIGGGTGGAPAGIGAARSGARTLVVEYLHGLGGVGTLGAISKYYWGNRVGFSKSIAPEGGWQIEQKMEVWRAELRKAGAHIWFGTLGCGAFVEDGKVRGAIVATPFGRGVVLANVVIDSTGNADIAAAAGARTIYTDAADVALQGTGLPPRTLGASYTNTDYTLVDETDMLDVWRLFVSAKVKAGNAFDLGQLIDTRERRRIVGDFTITLLDQLNGRTHPDTIVETWSNFDTHGYTTADIFYLRQPDKVGTKTSIPYRAMLPAGLDGILVTGLGISAHRDAVPLTRMQPDIQNGGYAAGVLASRAAKLGGATRKVDLGAVQKHLVDIGSLGENVLSDKDSLPLSKERVAEAVASSAEKFKGIAVVLAHPKEALPLLRKAYANASPQHRLPYAQILAIMGDPAGLPTLLEAVEGFDEIDKGWRYKGMGQFGRNMSDLDAYMVAAGRTGDRRATQPIIKKVGMLQPTHAFSHFRAVALALEQLKDPAAAEPLAKLIQTEGIRGKALLAVGQAVAIEAKGSSWTATTPRAESLRELMLARALLRCGDKDGLGRKVLEEYAQDLRGHLARHAKAILATEK
ncbi:FAD-dependent oxidoreductase [bacterium]|nr:FAD-dependent oxidoreductase [bacterium]